jgi:hypothetical protein
VARSEIEPFLGVRTSAGCGFARAGSCLALLSGNSLVATGHSQGVRFGEPRARGERVGCPGQGRCQALCRLPRVTCDELGLALAVGGLAPRRGLLPATLGLLTQLPLLAPPEVLSLSLGRPLPGSLVTLISQALAPVRKRFTMVGGRLALIRDPLALIGGLLALVCGLVALVGGLLALVRPPLALVGHALIDRRLSVLTTALTLATQPGTLALEGRILGPDLRRPARNL